MEDGGNIVGLKMNGGGGMCAVHNVLRMFSRCCLRSHGQSVEKGVAIQFDTLCHQTGINVS